MWWDQWFWRSCFAVNMGPLLLSNMVWETTSIGDRFVNSWMVVLLGQLWIGKATIMRVWISSGKNEFLPHSHTHTPHVEGIQSNHWLKWLAGLLEKRCHNVAQCCFCRWWVGPAVANCAWVRGNPCSTWRASLDSVDRITGSTSLRASLWGNIGDRRLGARKSGFGVPAA